MTLRVGPGEWKLSQLLVRVLSKVRKRKVVDNDNKNDVKSAGDLKETGREKKGGGGGGGGGIGYKSDNFPGYKTICRFNTAENSSTMIQTKAIAVLFLAGQILCQSQSDKSQQSSITNYDPQLLNYQLQQLALQQYSGQQSAQYATQSAQQQAGQTQQLTQQDYDAARILQAKLFEQYQGQFGNIQSQAGQFAAQQSAPIAPAASIAHQPSHQQLSKQSLLGVAYSSAADASKTSFTGYGIKYSF